jgi:predicted MFS family arabinose efflux permease
LGSALGGFIGGPILENWGGQAVFMIFGLVVLFVTPAVALLQQRWLAAAEEVEA